MATPNFITEDVDYAKNMIMNSDMSQEFKKKYNNLLNTATESTNGISPEEKIQKITESIAMLATTQVMYMIEIQEKIKEQINTANREQCKDCKAMKHAKEIEREKEDKEKFRDYLIGLGINPDDPTGSNTKSEERSWNEILKAVLLKPYLYVVLGLMAFTPYGVEIIKMLINAFGK